MKGISLTTNTLIVVIICILVLTMIVYFVLKFSRSEEVDWQGMYELGCLKLILDCDANLNSIEVESKGERYSLYTICITKLQMDEDTCRENCGCLV